MKNTTLTTIVSIALACAGLGMASVTRAAHYTNFLDALSTDVGARLETTDDAAQKRALTSANKALNRNTKTLSQDLSVLNSAAGALGKTFEDDDALNGLQSDALNSFITEAESQLGAVESDASLNTNAYPRALSNALSQAHDALDAAHADTNIATRIRALNLAFTRIKVAQIQTAHMIKAPASLDGKTVSVHAKAQGEKPTKFTLADDQTYDNGNGETGTWSYTRTGSNTGTITQNVDGGGTHVLDVTFKSTKNGSFTAEGEEVSGNISVK